MKTLITEIKNILDGINTRLKEAEWISNLEDRAIESNQAEQVREKQNKNKNRLREISDTIEHNNIHIMGIPKGEDREKGVANSCEEIILENFPNVGKEIQIQIQEAQRGNKINLRRSKQDTQ